MHVCIAGASTIKKKKQNMSFSPQRLWHCDGSGLRKLKTWVEVSRPPVTRHGMAARRPPEKIPCFAGDRPLSSMKTIRKPLENDGFYRKLMGFTMIYLWKEPPFELNWENSPNFYGHFSVCKL